MNIPFGFRRTASFSVVLCVAALLFVTTSLAAEQEQPKESFYSQMIRTVVRLEEHQSTCTPGREWAVEKDVPVGSAFFVRDRSPGEGDKEINRFFIVTARHVVERKADLFARVQAGPGNAETAVLVLPRSLWVFHPTPAPQGYLPIDVAVMQIPPTPFLKAFLYCAAEDNPAGCGVDKTTKNAFRNQVGEPPAVMDRAVFFGFPGGDVGTRAVDPFVRSGIVAYTAPNPDLRIDGRQMADDTVFLVDSPSFPGNSGGPLIREQLPLAGGVHLWGLMTAGNTIGRDYAIVTSVKRIRETLIHAREKATLNRQAWYKETPRLPLKCVPSPEKRPN
jgi:S1-C subfamily serine protease